MCQACEWQRHSVVTMAIFLRVPPRAAAPPVPTRRRLCRAHPGNVSSTAWLVLSPCRPAEGRGAPCAFMDTSSFSAGRPENSITDGSRDASRRRATTSGETVRSALRPAGENHERASFVDCRCCGAPLLVWDRLERRADAPPDRVGPASRLPRHRYRQPTPPLPRGRRRPGNRSLDRRRPRVS